MKLNYSRKEINKIDFEVKFIKQNSKTIKY